MHLFGRKCEFSHRCVPESVHKMVQVQEKVDTQHHKHPARPQRVHQQQAITSVCCLSHFAAQDLIRGSLQHTKQGTPKQAGNSGEKLPGSWSISRKGFGNLRVELQATNVRATACFLSQLSVGRTHKVPQIPGRCWENDGKGTFKEEVVVKKSFHFIFSSLADEGEQRSAAFKLGGDKLLFNQQQLCNVFSKQWCL